VDWVERPTGGGLAFHGSDVSVSVVVPRALGLSLAQLMRAVGHAATQLCRSYGAEAVASDQPAQGPITYCLAEPSPYAITVGDRKLAGLAVRRYPESWLIQGSLLIQPVPDALRQVVPRDVLEVLARRAISLAEAVKAPMSERDAAHRWAGRWMEWWEDGLIREWAGAR
jgi:lipoate-protein ligase A